MSVGALLAMLPIQTDLGKRERNRPRRIALVFAPGDRTAKLWQNRARRGATSSALVRQKFEVRIQPNLRTPIESAQ